jgi:hypothetical protein
MASSARHFSETTMPPLTIAVVSFVVGMFVVFGATLAGCCFYARERT